MMALLDTSHDLMEAEAEFGGVCDVGQLLTPLTRYRNRAVVEDRPFAIDNGAYSTFEARAYLALLEREKPNRSKCLFVAAPDVVGSARRTLEVFSYWYPKLSLWPVALVAQDGLEDLDIPWPLLSAIFIGGSTEWKVSAYAGAIVKAAKAMGKWAHVGRINTPARWDRFEEMGADSCDGTGISRYSHMREAMTITKSNLFTEKAAT